MDTGESSTSGMYKLLQQKMLRSIVSSTCSSTLLFFNYLNLSIQYFGLWDDVLQEKGKRQVGISLENGVTCDVQIGFQFEGLKEKDGMKD
jgi:hypothetical protein